MKEIIKDIGLSLLKFSIFIILFGGVTWLMYLFFSIETEPDIFVDILGIVGWLWCLVNISNFVDYIIPPKN